MNEYRPGSFSILPPVVKNLIIINVLFFLATIVLKKANIINLDLYLDLYYPTSPLFHFWQPITYLFMHGGFGHIFFNMFALWMFGYVIENIMGPKRFLIFYFVCGLGAALCHIGVTAIQYSDELSVLSTVPTDKIMEAAQQYLSGQMVSGVYAPMLIPTLGASGAIFGLLFAFGYLFPNMMIYLYFLFPIKAKWFVAGYAALELYNGVVGTQDGVAHFAHLGGILFAFIMLKIWNMSYKNV